MKIQLIKDSKLFYNNNVMTITINNNYNNSNYY